MKLAIISPSFPPKICGVGDHSLFLADALRKQNHNVTIFTSQIGADSSSTEAYTSLNVLKKKVLQLMPEVLLIQYTPYLYDRPLGLGFSLLFFLFGLRRSKKIKLVMLAHELHYPINLTFSGLTIGIFQKLKFRLLASFVDLTIFTYEMPYSQYKNTTLSSWLPVGSNIPTTRPKVNIFEKYKLQPNTKIVLHFGGAHPTHLYDFILKCDELLRKQKNFPAKIICIGISADELNSWFFARRLAVKNEILCLGKLPADEISAWLQASSIFIAPFLDGISSRRGSVMAALAHSVPVITNESYSTDKNIPWRSFCKISSSNNAEAFAMAALDVLLNEHELKSIGTLGNKYYSSHFDWPVIAQQLVKISSE